MSEYDKADKGRRKSNAVFSLSESEIAINTTVMSALRKGNKATHILDKNRIEFIVSSDPVTTLSKTSEGWEHEDVYIKVRPARRGVPMQDEFLWASKDRIEVVCVDLTGDSDNGNPAGVESPVRAERNVNKTSNSLSLNPNPISLVDRRGVDILYFFSATAHCKMATCDPTGFR